MLRGNTWRRLVIAALLICSAVPDAWANGGDGNQPQSVGPYLWQPSMNVFRRFAVEAEAMFEFYGEVLGFEPLQTFDVGGGTQVARFQAGASQVKFTRRVPDRSYQPGGVTGATGLRLLTFFFPDEAALTARFKAHGLAAPEFRDLGGGRRHALVTDPDGQAVELIVAEGAEPSLFERIEVGLTVGDIAASRDFYRDFVGLEELPPREDPTFGTTVYPFRHGSTTINLRSFGPDLPADTGSGGIQYVVSNVDVVNALAKKRGIVIDQPLSKLEGFDLRTIWLDDPDGITNYFAETGQSRDPALMKK